MSMGRLSLTYRVPWEGGTEETSIVVVLDGLDFEDDSQLNGVADAGVTALASALASNRTVIRANIYSMAGLGPNFMYLTKDYSTAGTHPPTSNMFAEAVVQIRAKLPRSFGVFRSNQPYLRKSLHAGFAHGVPLTGENTKVWQTPNSSLTSFVNWLNAPYTGLTVVSESGDAKIGSWQQSSKLMHRQFRRGRKEYVND